MTEAAARKIVLAAIRPRTHLILFDDAGHKILREHTVRQAVQCSTVIDVGDEKWEVKGWGPTDSTDCRAICNLKK